LQPVFLRTKAYRVREHLRTDSIRETSLDLVMMMMMRHGVEYDPRVIVDGADVLPDPSSSAPMLIALPHTMLSVLLPRVLRDRGLSTVGISADPIKIAGTRTDARILVPSRKLLLTVRELFRNGEIVSAMIDRGEAEPRNVSVSTLRGEFLISTPLLDLALRHRVRVLFASAMLDARGNVVMTFVAPPQNDDTTVDDLLGAFASFIDTYVHRG
jgi:hypothetical protein